VCPHLWWMLIDAVARRSHAGQVKLAITGSNLTGVDTYRPPAPHLPRAPSGTHRTPLICQRRIPRVVHPEDGRRHGRYAHHSHSSRPLHPARFDRSPPRGDARGLTTALRGRGFSTSWSHLHERELVTCDSSLANEHHRAGRRRDRPRRIAPTSRGHDPRGVSSSSLRAGSTCALARNWSSPLSPPVARSRRHPRSPCRSITSPPATIHDHLARGLQCAKNDRDAAAPPALPLHRDVRRKAPLHG